MNSHSTPSRLALMAVVCFFSLVVLSTLSADEGTGTTPAVVQEAGIHGGLCVQIGAKDMELASELARTGRYLVQVLDTDESVVAEAKKQLSQQGLYGLVTVDMLTDTSKLPYTENLVNLFVVLEKLTAANAMDEVLRTICPNGIILAAEGALPEKTLKESGLLNVRRMEENNSWTVGSVPWPADMDDWSHPRHSASGNAASEDRLVGPPRRIRWLAGPWQEISNMVTSDGRNYYGGLWVRDSFNGLRLWQQSLRPTPANGGFGYRPASGSAPPVAGDGYVFVLSGGKVLALDGKTGETVREFVDTGKPKHLLHEGGVLIAVDDHGLRAFNVQDAKPLWVHEASEPRYVVAGEDTIGLMQGSPRRGEKSQLVALDMKTGEVRWSRDDLPWADKASRSVYYRGMLTFEVSSLNDEGPGNAIHILDANDGKTLLDYDFLPGMNHMRQARAMYVDNVLWLLHGGKDQDNKRQPIQVSAIDYLTGETRVTYPAGLAHCFPPVATPNYLLSGELDFTDLRTGQMDANRISKAACGRDNGWVPANGLVYLAPKHCVCWPMLRGYVALATERPGGNPAPQDTRELNFRLTKGIDPPTASESIAVDDDWPCYRHDAWRSSSTTSVGPTDLTTLWTTDLGNSRVVEGPITQDWDENPFVKGPVTPPVISDGLVFVARPDAHQVVALAAANGHQAWTFTADGRVDTPPTIHQGLCMFGTKNGSVYCLQAADGALVWRLRAAPIDEQIVAYGGLESPCPVPGSVLVIEGSVYFAAGRQSFADGGILVFKVDPPSGKIDWVQRLDSVPQEGFYRSSGLEFDNFDLLFRQGDGVAMSRWLFDREDGKMSVEPWSAFALLNTGGGTAVVPQGSWSYAPRNQSRTKTFSPKRPLVVFRDNQLVGCLEGMRSLYHCEFDEEAVKTFDKKWITGWANSSASREDGIAWRSQRLAENATWTIDIYNAESDKGSVDALVMANDRLYLAGSDGRLEVRSVIDGQLQSERDIPAPTWDGMAIANGRLFVATHDGRVLCLGE
jgi:outer membrane protein assembly factor BamB